MFRAGVHPCGLLMFCVLEDSVVMTKLCSVPSKVPEKSSQFRVALPNSKQANHTWPFVHHLSKPGWSIDTDYGGVHIPPQRKSHCHYPINDRSWILFQLLSNGVSYCKTNARLSSLVLSLPLQKNV